MSDRGDGTYVGTLVCRLIGVHALHVSRNGELAGDGARAVAALLPKLPALRRCAMEE